MTLYNYALTGLGASATASGTGGGSSPGLAIDGSGVTYWQEAGSVLHKWLAVDLGAPRYISQVDVIHGAAEVTQTFDLHYSTDGSTWILIGAYGRTTSPDSIDTGGIIARYWRVGYNTNFVWDSWRLYTVALMGPVERPPDPPLPTCEVIAGWLDYLDANYVPCVQDWLDAN